MANYFKERERNTNMRLREIRDTLPEFCEEFFVGIEPQTTALTRLNYAYDLRIFFDYLTKRVRAFRDMAPEDITLSDLEKITVTHLENYLEYLTLYDFEGNSIGKVQKIREELEQANAAKPAKSPLFARFSSIFSTKTS